MTTHLKGENTYFLPFNKGNNNGAGNPPNPKGIKTDYLWKDILTKDRLTNIIQNYVQLFEEETEKILPDGNVKKEKVKKLISITCSALQALTCNLNCRLCITWNRQNTVIRLY